LWFKEVDEKKTGQKRKETQKERRVGHTQAEKKNLGG